MTYLAATGDRILLIAAIIGVIALVAIIIAIIAIIRKRNG